MDKYEYNLKLEEIDKLVDQGDYKEAAKLADTIEWRRVRNVRTLCLISEIYEAAGELDKSKDMLVRAYRKSPVGRNVLYRLVEVTTALGQYDEALEYYSEYVQTAPHDNNRYILKYMIYKGRGSSAEELIAILEEYLGQEYTERWAYELAALYQQAGQIQKCLATCDDLVLWFHSGKYVKKALELKKRYAALTPKQQQIYEVCMQEEAQSDYFEDTDEETTVAAGTEDADDEVIAENIIAETEKEIADEITAHKAELEKETEPEKPAEIRQRTRILRRESKKKEAGRKKSAEKEPMGKAEAIKESAGKAPEKKSPDIMEPDAMEPDAMKPDVMEPVFEEPDIPEPAEQDDLQIELAKSVRKVISGVARKPELNEDDVPAAVEERLQVIQEVSQRKEPEPMAGRLSIDDILLSMGEKGKQAAAAARAQREREAAAALEPSDESAKAVPGATDASAEENPAGESREVTSEAEKAAEPEKPESEKPEPEKPESEKSESEKPESEKPESEKSEPEKPELEKSDSERSGSELSGAGSESRAESSLPRSIAAAAAEELTQEQLEAIRYSSNPEKLLKNRTSLPSYTSDEDLGETRRIVNTKEELLEAARKELLATRTIRIPTEEVAKAYASDAGAARRFTEGAQELRAVPAENISEASDMEQESGSALAEEFSDMEQNGEGTVPENEDDAAQRLEESMPEEEEFDDGEYYDDPLTIEPHLRGFFKGFTEIEGLEDQIANAILQAMAKGDDRTSRNGNILIFGSHGSGKTTLATNIAKAIAMEKGRKVAKMAKIYAADLNRRDIAATIAKIAGGTLIVEEAGDLDDNTVEQLTTAMEFRTDGLIVILEDEQRYVHDLLMNHPRFTMKFTAQVYLPVYTAEELSIFAQQHANELDYMISGEGFEAIHRKVEEASSTETPMSVADVIALVDRAIHRSNKFIRKMSMGKKRYDENDYVLLFARDFK
ncbi:MAG: hypothetical protein LUI07_01655 [Lachnospiraceae bacterium]|nr:hypothetical protein [Lachnospiraceae bacterium]